MPSETATNLAAKFLAEADAGTAAAATILPNDSGIVIVFNRGSHDATIVFSNRGTVTVGFDGSYGGSYNPNSFRHLLDDIRHHLARPTLETLDTATAPASDTDPAAAAVTSTADADTATAAIDPAPATDSAPADSTSEGGG